MLAFEVIPLPDDETMKASPVQHSLSPRVLSCRSIQAFFSTASPMTCACALRLFYVKCKVGNIGDSRVLLGRADGSMVEGLVSTAFAGSNCRADIADLPVFRCSSQ